MTDQPTPWWAYVIAGVLIACATTIVVAVTIAAVRAALT